MFLILLSVFPCFSFPADSFSPDFLAWHSGCSCQTAASAFVSLGPHLEQALSKLLGGIVDLALGRAYSEIRSSYIPLCDLHSLLERVLSQRRRKQFSTR